MKKNNFSLHLTILIIVTVLCALVYATVQQAHRSGADDPQLQLALDLKNALDDNRSPQPWMDKDSIDISRSLSVFKTLYNRDGVPLASTGFLDGAMPQMPKGVFDFTAKHQQDVFTWQPRRGVRMATVVEAVHSPQVGFVAVGRSLKEVEKRESNLTTMVLVAWLVCAGIILLHFIVSYLNSRASN